MYVQYVRAIKQAQIEPRTQKQVKQRVEDPIAKKKEFESDEYVNNMLSGG